MDANDTVRLLILNDSRSEAERLISMLHNAGRPTRAQHVTSEEALAKLLQEQAWDLLIGHDQTSNVTPAMALKQIRRLNREDRKSTRLNSSHVAISYAVFCLKKKNKQVMRRETRD